LDIKEEEAEKDNISIASVSEYSYSMSQAVFKNTRLPPLFGSKEFLSKPYLNLFTEEDANELSQYRNSVLQLPTSPDSGSPSRDVSESFLAPPPPLEEVLNQIPVSQINENAIPQFVAPPVFQPAQPSYEQP
jgi:hypothetical protein